MDPFIKVFTLLGEFLRQFPDRTRNDSGKLLRLNDSFYDQCKTTLEQEHIFNPWFTPESVDRAILGIAGMLDEKVLREWLGKYHIIPPAHGRELTVGLVLAGNIPMVGFHDLLCVLATGQRVLAKTSSRDDRLIRKLAGAIAELDPGTGERISFTDDRLTGMDAIIATGSDNSARYFEYYFREIPHIIRKNRNGVAVLTGSESVEELAGIGEDIFTYFGMGCRNVTKLYLPADYDLKVLLGVLDRFSQLGQHHKYINNVDYYRSIFLMNQQEFLDNGVLLLKEDTAIASPVGVVYYERYSEIGAVHRKLKEREDEIQCVVSLHPGIEGGLPPGTTQEPMPWDYADGVDTIRFLTELK